MHLKAAPGAGERPPAAAAFVYSRSHVGGMLREGAALAVCLSDMLHWGCSADWQALLPGCQSMGNFKGQESNTACASESVHYR